MFNNLSKSKYIIIFCVIVLNIISVFLLHSTASQLFPNYYLYIGIGIILFVIFSLVDIQIISYFYKYIYIGVIILLLLPLIIGQATRGTIRWIPLGFISLQPSEIVKPFLIIFFSFYLSDRIINNQKFVKSLVLFLIPIILIYIQPSLGVSLVTAASFGGIILASNIERKKILILFAIVLVSVPLIYIILAPYQKERLMSFLNPSSDPSGGGYNSIQAMISVGAGGFLGRGLGRGLQTQLDFLPEKQNDFIFASLSEEMGFIGSFFVLVLYFIILYAILDIYNNSRNNSSKLFLIGTFCLFLAETTIHIGMNLGMLPVTGIPLPFLSAGGSALIGSFITMAFIVRS